MLIGSHAPRWLTALELVLLLAAAFFFGIAYAQWLGGATVEKLLTLLVAPAVTVVASYAGARYAYRFQLRRAEEDRRERQIEAVNLALFELARVANKFIAVDKQYIEEHRNSRSRHYTILPMLDYPWKPPRFPYANLGFLFRSSDPNALGTLALLEEEIASTWEALRMRSKLHADFVQPAVEHHMQTDNTTLYIDEEVLNVTLGVRRVGQLRHLTDSIVRDVRGVIFGASDHVDRLRALAAEIHADGVFLRFSLPQAYAELAAANRTPTDAA